MAAILVSLYGPADAEWINIIVMVPLLLLFGEVTLKTIAVSNPVRYSSSVVAAPLLVWVRLIAPVRGAVRFVADHVATLIVGEEKAPENLLHIDEFKTLVSEAEEEGGITPTERTLVYNLLAAGTTEIVEIMIPRTQTLFIDADRPISEIFERVHQYGTIDFRFTAAIATILSVSACGGPCFTYFWTRRHLITETGGFSAPASWSATDKKGR